MTSTWHVWMKMGEIALVPAFLFSIHLLVRCEREFNFLIHFDERWKEIVFSEIVLFMVRAKISRKVDSHYFRSTVRKNEQTYCLSRPTDGHIIPYSVHMLTEKHAQTHEHRLFYLDYSTLITFYPYTRISRAHGITQYHWYMCTTLQITCSFTDSFSTTFITGHLKFILRMLWLVTRLSHRRPQLCDQMERW